jgi:HEAT repeat protein
MGLVKRPPEAASTAAPAEAPSFEALSERFRNGDDSARRRAALELSRFPESAEILCAALIGEGQAAVREAILTALIRINNGASVRGLLPLLGSEDVALRNGVVEALQQMPAHVGPHMQELLADTDSDIRIFALDVLQSLCHPDAPAWLAALILTEKHVNVCAVAVDRLAEVGTPGMIPALQALAARFADEPFIQFAVQAAIARIKGS